DADGDLDIICGNENDNEIWVNNGKGFFKNETETRMEIKTGEWETREVDLGDIDGDGDLDMFLANVNFLQTKDHQNRLFLNDGKGHFEDVTASHLPAEKMHTVDGDFVDWDGDGDRDLITSNGFGNSYQFYQNDGKGKFSNVTEEVLPASVKGDGIDIEAADYNGDGKLDLYLCNFRGSDILLLGK
ncbi:MAG: VCBS repeat-containing protein, partial [Bacteroidota bacterium]